MIRADDRLRRGVLAIAREAARSGAALPGEHELARRLEANRPQVRRVLGELEQSGILHRHQGAATTVDPIGLLMTVRLEDQLEHSELLDRLGYEPEVRVLEHDEITVGHPVSDTLAVEAGARALRTRKQWRADGRPAMLTDNILLLPDGAGTSGLDPAESAFALIETLWGEPVLWEVATPGVSVLSGEEAALFELEPPAACLTITLVGMLRSGRRVFHAFERHNPDIVQYSMVRRFPEPWA